jgi:hypothetical protein
VRWFIEEGNAMSVVVDPSARETFTPRELTDAYKQFEERGPQYLDAETGLRAAAYRFDTRVLLVFEESGAAGLVILYSPNLVEDKVLQRSEFIHSG